MFASIADLYSAGTRNNSVCILQAFQTQFFEFAGTLWTVCFSIFIFCVAVYNLNKKGTVEIVFHVIVWPTALLTSALPFITSSYGHTSAYVCWIDPSSTAGVVWEWLLSYIPAFISMPVVLALFLLVIVNMAKRYFYE
jgi:hypothetical protein